MHDQAPAMNTEAARCRRDECHSTASRRTEREYRKTGTVYARKVDGTETVNVYSLEGPAVARPGDYIVRSADGGEEWVVAGDRFETTYEPVEGITPKGPS